MAGHPGQKPNNLEMPFGSGNFLEVILYTMDYITLVLVLEDAF